MMYNTSKLTSINIFMCDEYRTAKTQILLVPDNPAFFICDAKYYNVCSYINVIICIYCSTVSWYSSKLITYITIHTRIRSLINFTSSSPLSHEKPTIYKILQDDNNVGYIYR